MDDKLQIVQTGVAKAGVAMACMLHMVGSPLRLQFIDKTINTDIEGITCLGQAYHLLCLRRRELMKPDRDW